MKTILKVSAVALTIIAGASAAQAGSTIYFDGYTDWAQEAVSPKD